MDHHELSSEPTPPVATAISVSYRNVEGYHTFTSEDVRGLYVASKDARQAFRDVSIVLKELVELKAKITCIIEPMVRFEEWLDNLDGGVHSADGIHPLALGSGRYLVKEAA